MHYLRHGTQWEHMAATHSHEHNHPAVEHDHEPHLNADAQHPGKPTATTTPHPATADRS